MDFNRRKKKPLEISLTPMIDVVFLLLIFFMVTTTFNRQTEIKINLPDAQGTEAADQPKVLTLMINASGQYFISRDKGAFLAVSGSNSSALQKALMDLAGESRTIPFIINADAQTPHQAVITAMDIASRIGFKKITFATQRITEEQ